MGDIFWDYDERRDALLVYPEPRHVAVEAVASALHEFAVMMESNPMYTSALRLEYHEIVKRVGTGADDRRLISAMIQKSAWTERGASVVLQLAKEHGTSILRNALALAEAMGVEDGEAGL